MGPLRGSLEKGKVLGKDWNASGRISFWGVGETGVAKEGKKARNVKFKGKQTTMG